MVNGQPVVALQNISCFLRLSQLKHWVGALFAAVQDMYVKSPKYCTLTVLIKVQLPSCLSLSDVHVVIIVTKHWIDWDVLPLYAFISFPQWMNRVFSKICQLWWLQTYRKASFTIVGFSWTKYANSYIARVERTSHHVWCQVLVKSGTLERILSTLPRISHFGRGYHYSAGFTPCQQAQPPIWFFLVCELLLTECLWGRLFTRCPPPSISNVNQTIH